MPVVKNLMVRAGADFSAITKQSKKVQASMKGMESTVRKSCSRMSVAAAGMKKAFAAIGAAVSVVAIGKAAKDAKDAYDAQAEASAKLAQVMRNTMGATKAEIQSIEDYIDAQERLGVVAGDVQTEGAQELATYLTLSSSLKTLIPVLNDMVAQQYGIGASAESAVSIATMLGKVMNGQTSALSRYGYTFDAAQEAVLKYGTEAQRAAVLAEVVGESVGGMNKALAATPNGRLQQVANTLGKIQENFGRAVNNVLVLFLPALNRLCTVLADVATLSNKVAQSIANVFGSKSAGASKTVQYTGAVANSIGEVEDAAVSASKAMSNLMGFDQINKLSSSSSGGVAAADTGASSGGSIIETVDVDTSAAEESIGWLEKCLKPLKTALEEISGLIGNISDLLSGDKTFGEFFESLTPAQTALVAIAGALGAIAIVSAGMTGLAAITTFFKTVKTLNAAGLIGKIAEVFLLAASGAGTLHEAIAAVFGPKSIIAGVGAVIGGAILAVTNFASMLKNGFSWAHEALMLVGIALTAVGAIILGAPAMIAGVVAAVVASVATAVVLIKSHWAEVKTDFAANMAGIQKEISARIEAIKSIFKGLLQVLKGLFTRDLKTIFDGVKNMVKGVINYIISCINGVIRGFNSILTPIRLLIVEVGKVAGKSWSLSDISVPTIPHLATGGIITRPTTALIGESGPEAVVPLAENAAWLDALASRISSLIAGSRQTYHVTIPVYVGGRKVSEIVIKDINAYTDDTGVFPMRI